MRDNECEKQAENSVSCVRVFKLQIRILLEDLSSLKLNLNVVETSGSCGASGLEQSVFNLRLQLEESIDTLWACVADSPRLTRECVHKD